MRKQWWIGWLGVAAVAAGPAAVADEPPASAAAAVTLDQFLTEGGYTDDIRKVGTLFLQMEHPDEAARVARNFTDNYWATQPDAGLTPDRAAIEADKLKASIESVGQTVRSYAPADFRFVGVDKLGLWAAQDWYYLSLTPKGPLLVRVSMQFGGRARLIGFRAVTGWDNVKAALAGIEFKAGDRVMTITYEVPTTRPATQP